MLSSSSKYAQFRHYLGHQKCPRRFGSTKIPTLNINTELPKDLSSIPTHELFVKTGFFLHPKPGLVHWMPIGLKVLRNVQAIVRKHMENAGAEEVSLSSLSSSRLWEKTGRWSNSELFKLKDSKEDSYCLAATCEEEITDVVKKNLKSYKQLPQLYFQINNKYRDEIRPRSGLLRGREFIMKDAYSFDVDEDSALKAYDNMVKAYVNIFDDLKIPYVKAVADTGEIGGSLSHEWHYLHGTAGEDTLFSCMECGNNSNIEKTLSYPVEQENALEVSVKYFSNKDRDTLICAYYPSKRVLQEELLKIHIPDIDLTSSKNQNMLIEEFSGEDFSKRVIRIMDARLNSTSKLPDFPIPFINRSFISTMFDTPIVSAEAGEFCGECEEGLLTAYKSIEVGHTFYLGDKYSKPMDLSVMVPKDGQKAEKSNVLMGCYGIGISRIIAAMGVMLRDKEGFKWPKNVAPWQISVIVAGQNVEEKILQEISSQLSDWQVKVDTRDKSLGSKISESRMIGIPLNVIVGKKYPRIDVEVRGVLQGETINKLYQEKKNVYDWEFNENKHSLNVEGLKCLVGSLMKDLM